MEEIKYLDLEKTKSRKVKTHEEIMELFREIEELEKKLMDRIDRLEASLPSAPPEV